MKGWKLIIMGSCCCSSAYVSLSCSETVERDRFRKGYVPILVGKEMGDMEKLWIPIKLLSHPRIVALLRRSAHEFGFQQQGLLKIKHDVHLFKGMIKSILSKSKQIYVSTMNISM